MKPPIEYRQRSPASSSGRTPDFGSGKGGSNPSAGTKIAGERGFRGLTPAETLTHKRALKAAQMKRYRENLKKKGKP